jgi:hypothetical protein
MIARPPRLRSAGQNTQSLKAPYLVQCSASRALEPNIA